MRLLDMHFLHITGGARRPIQADIQRCGGNAAGCFLQPLPIKSKELPMKKMTAFLCLVLLLSACVTKEQKIQRMCEASYKETLLNPETAEFHDFEEISAKEVNESFWLSLTSRSLPRDGWQDIVNDKKAEPGSIYYQMRLRADGAMGNKVTKPLLCLIPPSGEKCKCATVETSLPSL
jgi:hypothetical protein